MKKTIQLIIEDLCALELLDLIRGGKATKKDSYTNDDIRRYGLVADVNGKTVYVRYRNPVHKLHEAIA